MTNKYRSSYAEGGFLDDGASVDPVSGNEVPVGSLAEEVRDDVPAQLSEGEFVVPADVVRFIGLDKLMKMRNAAKAGLADMEAEGQVGGQPAPIMEEPMMDDDMEMDALIDGMDGGDFDSAVQRFAEGGSVIPSYDTYTGRKFNEPEATVEYVKYTNAAGDIIDVPHVRGKPVTPVPDGYYMVGSTDEVTSTAAPIASGGGGGGGQGKRDNKNDPNNPWQGIVSDADSDSIKLHHQIRNDKMVRNRRNDIQEMITGIDSGNVDPRGEDNPYTYQTSIDKIKSRMTPEALAVVDGWVNDPSWIDKQSLKLAGWTEAEMYGKAQSQVDNANKAAKKVDIEYKNIMLNGTPEQKKVNQANVFGENVSLGEFFTGLVSGAIDFYTSGPSIIGALISGLPSGVDKEKVEKQITLDAEEVISTGVITPKIADVAEKVDQVISTPTPVNSLTEKERGEMAGTELPVPTQYLQPYLATDPVNPLTEKERGEMSGTELPVKESLLNTAGTEYAPEGSGITASEPVTYDTPPTDGTIDAGLRAARDATDMAAATQSSDAFFQEQEDIVTGKALIQGYLEEQQRTGLLGKPAADKLRAGMDLAALAESEFQLGEEREKAIKGLDALLDAEDEENAFYQTQYDNQLTKVLNENALTNKENARLNFTAPPTGADLGVTGTTALAATPTTGTTAALGVPYSENMEIDNLMQVRKIAEAIGINPDFAIQAYKDTGSTDSIVKMANDKTKQDRKDKQDAYDRQAASVRLEEAQRKSAQDAETQRLLDSQNRRQQRQITPPTAPEGGRPTQSQTPVSSVNSGGDGAGQRQRDSKGNATKGGEVTAGTTGKNTTGKSFNYGGLVSPSKPKIKKMRNDPTAGLASKKKAKQKAQAKKGALAAKRT
jgi:hypothetical protein